MYSALIAWHRMCEKSSSAIGSVIWMMCAYRWQD
jgi:hypothetical protein